MSRYVSLNTGLDLLDEVIDVIEKHPEQWEQGDYRCASGMCVSGWACELKGGLWVAPADGDYRRDRLLWDDGDDQQEYTAIDVMGVKVVHAHDRAARLLGIGEEAADELFSGTNELEDIKRIRNEIASGAYDGE